MRFNDLDDPERIPRDTDFARVRGRFEDRGRLGWAFCCRDEILFLQGELPLGRRDAETIEGRDTLRAGETRCLSLAYTRRDIAVVPELGRHAVARVEQTRQWWRDWIESCLVGQQYRKPIVRSALVLKLLSHSLSGAVVAAATSSLPEVIGGVRNWDYRYCWLRDAALTFEAFVELGYTREAEFFIDWLLHTTRLSWPRLDVMYDIYGERSLPEQKIDHLEGYRGSRPVRIGNGAHNQVQLDVYGSVIDAVYDYVQRGGRLDSSEARVLVGFGRKICELWREPDDGIWEVRQNPRHHTYSKIMCWIALDRILKLHDRGWLRVRKAQFERERDAIREMVEEQGFNRCLNSYVAWFGSETADASLLLAARGGYCAPDDPRMQGTYDFIKRELGVKGMLYRYPPGKDGLPGKEGAFGIASFWAVQYLALCGRQGEAHEMFEGLCNRANDIGLFAEEIDPETDSALGNYPQAFTHVGLLTAALALRRAQANQPELPDTGANGRA